MVRILDGNSDHVANAHVRSNLCYLISLRHLIRSRAGTNRILFIRTDLFSFMRAQHVLSYYKYHAYNRVRIKINKCI